MVPTSSSVSGESPIKSYPSIRCFWINKSISFTYSLGAFETAAFALGLGASEYVCEPLKSRISIPYAPLVLEGVSPIGF